MTPALEGRTVWQIARAALDTGHSAGLSPAALWPLQHAEATAYRTAHGQHGPVQVAPPPTAIAINHRVVLTVSGPPPPSPCTTERKHPVTYTNGATETPAAPAVRRTLPIPSTTPPPLTLDLTASEWRCRIAGCDQRRELRGVCPAHYSKVRAAGLDGALFLPSQRAPAAPPAPVEPEPITPAVLLVEGVQDAATLTALPPKPRKAPTVRKPVALAVPAATAAATPADWPHLVLPDPAGGPGCVLAGPDLASLLRGLATLRGAC